MARTGRPTPALPASTEGPHTGATAIQCSLRTGGGPFGGFYFLDGVLPAGAAAPSPMSALKSCRLSRAC